MFSWYSDGAMPVHFLNCREKLAGLVYPKRWATNGELNASSRNYIDKLLAYYKVIARQHVNID